MPHEIFLTSAELCQLLRCSSTTLWRMRQNPEFPQPRHFGRRLCGCAGTWNTSSRSKPDARLAL